ncbi:hypothetical protein [Rhizobium leguminosarum]|uniref:hypothetical protein n=1 Tax=Rhizobium leguminosarum TaxID=384 RepID=UPI0013BAE706|nr:hypothetical protein [Rhizobium leguminosarum]
MLDLATKAADRRIAIGFVISPEPTTSRIIFVSKAPSTVACGTIFWLQILDEALPRRMTSGPSQFNEIFAAIDANDPDLASAACRRMSTLQRQSPRLSWDDLSNDRCKPTLPKLPATKRGRSMVVLESYLYKLQVTRMAEANIKQSGQP